MGPYGTHPFCSGLLLLSWEAETSSRGPPATGHIRDRTGVTTAPAPLPIRRYFTDRVRDFVKGWLFLQEKPTTHFIYYILCDCVQFADTLMMVSMSGVLKMAWNQKVSHRGTSVFAAVVTNHCIVHLANICFDLVFLWTFWSAYVNAKILSGLTSLYRRNYATTLRAIMWHT